MARASITTDLAAQIDALDSSQLLDVVVELTQSEDDHGDIAAAKAAFQRAAEPVTQVIAGSGGEVLGGAWINQTLRARVPKHAVSEVAETEGVSALDVPHAIQAE